MTPQISKEAMEKAENVIRKYAPYIELPAWKHFKEKIALELTKYQKRIKELEKQLSRNSNANLGGL
jgi:hypothetical protein